MDGRCWPAPGPGCPLERRQGCDDKAVNMERIRKLAEDHWNNWNKPFAERLLRHWSGVKTDQSEDLLDLLGLVYVEAFVHGAKHAAGTSNVST